MIPKDLKNQFAKGIDSCVAEFRNTKMHLAIDAGGFGGGGIRKHETTLDFREEFLTIDGKKVQLVTYRKADTKTDRKFVAGLYVVLYESKPNETQTNAYLYMTIEGKSAAEIESAKQIFQSIHFDPYRPFLITW